MPGSELKNRSKTAPEERAVKTEGARILRKGGSHQTVIAKLTEKKVGTNPLRCIRKDSDDAGQESRPETDSEMDDEALTRAELEKIYLGLSGSEPETSEASSLRTLPKNRL
jgi:hypothetical protein